MSDDIIEILRESASDYLQAKVDINEQKGHVGLPRVRNRQQWQEIAELGWLGLALPESQGGSGMGIKAAASLCEIIGRRLFAEPYIAGALMPSVILGAAGDVAADSAEGLVSGAVHFALAWQEQVSEADNLTYGTRFEAFPEGGQVAGMLHGRKRFVCAVEDDGVLLVAATTPEGTAIVAVNANADGITVQRVATAQGHYAEVTFKNTPVRDYPLLQGAVADAALEKALAWGRVAAAAQLAGLARGALETTCDYVGQRRQFDRALSSFQSVAHRCADMRINVELADAAWSAAALELDLTERPAACASVYAAKARAGEVATMAGRTAVQLHGAMGFTEECDIGLFLRAAMQYNSWLGVPTGLLRQFMAHTIQPEFGAVTDNSSGASGGEMDRTGQTTETESNRELAGNRDALTDEQFRQELRTFLAANFPAEWRQNFHRPFRRLRGEQQVHWLRILNDSGWRAPAWPREYGGMGLSFRKQLIYHEELEHAGVARVIDLGESQLGPTLILLGSDEQRAHYLPKILNCEHVWCQGYSEPNAGSDLASLRTSAVLDGDEFVVNGQKIWTTHANDSTHIFTLVRTGKYEKKQQGISFLLIDLQTPGITVRPILNLAGEDEFCEVFFDNVRVPRENLVGELDQGWKVAKSLLGYERIWIGSPALITKALELSSQLLAMRELDIDCGARDRFAKLCADLHDYRLLYARICDDIADSGREPGPEVSMLKLYASELLQRVTEFNVEAAAEWGGVVGDTRIGDTLIDLHWQLMMSRPVTIFAGANEVQRDIIAKAVLKLPA
ncbi:acyl-CoA dehydrogenase [Aestuariicella hydrocarbonica]|uniref:Acyl-CoA dehydrogenase n=1 Tax=Pseudomaricurvus hydrocarbonicus TaxID=1470433 RepID=A0A9E5JXX2_9GAMM|nr:acyl-CoA dehydrogenase [Aestuariicella hydrocarbonica]NHO66641.1 acyl-CoA dehydrogenase [Aestuariicella hydrocarbonica]